MPQIGGKNAKKTSSDSKRHFTVIMGNKEHGLYVSSTPSSAAKKAVTKLCASNKGKKVEFHIREITQGSKKKTYGPYSGYIEKLKEPIELKGRVIKYKPVAKLSGKESKKMRGGGEGNKKTCFHYRESNGNNTNLRKNLNSDVIINNTKLRKWQPVEIIETREDPRSNEIFAKVIADNGVEGWVNIKYLYESSDPMERDKLCFT
jgi:hypothetical protein